MFGVHAALTVFVVYSVMNIYATRWGRELRLRMSCVIKTRSNKQPLRWEWAGREKGIDIR